MTFHKSITIDGLNGKLIHSCKTLEGYINDFKGVESIINRFDIDSLLVVLKDRVCHASALGSLSSILRPINTRKDSMIISSFRNNILKVIDDLDNLLILHLLNIIHVNYSIILRSQYIKSLKVISELNNITHSILPDGVSYNTINTLTNNGYPYPIELIKECEIYDHYIIKLNDHKISINIKRDSPYLESRSMGYSKTDIIALLYPLYIMQ